MRRPSQDFCLARLPSPLGTLLVVHDDARTLRALDFQDHAPRLHRLLGLHYGQAGRDFTLLEGDAPAVSREALAAYFEGRLAALDLIPVQTGGTDFQRIVWAALRQIAVGTTVSYGELAARIGRPTAVRAVGLANGANPIGVVVPCHRVIGANASLTGYAGGVERKRWLLEHEGAVPGARAGHRDLFQGP